MIPQIEIVPDLSIWNFPVPCRIDWTDGFNKYYHVYNSLVIISSSRQLQSVPLQELYVYDTVFNSLSHQDQVPRQRVNIVHVLSLLGFSVLASVESKHPSELEIIIFQGTCETTHTQDKNMTTFTLWLYLVYVCCTCMYIFNNINISSNLNYFYAFHTILHHNFAIPSFSSEAICIMGLSLWEYVPNICLW